MGVRSYIKNTVKGNTNFKSWTSWDAIKDNSQVIGGFVKDIKNPDEAVAPVSVTFDEAMKKYGLTENDIRKKMRVHLIVSICSFVFGVAALGWTFHILFKGMLLSCLVSLALSAMMFAYAFQESFRYYQLKQRRLNCTVREWFLNLVSFKR